MIIEPADRAEIARALKSNTLILFIGAGFSIGATNQLGESIPTGKELCEKLWSFCRLALPYDGRTTLKDLYELSLERDKTQLSFLLQSLFVAKDVPIWYQLVAKPFWFRIYTNEYRRCSRTQFPSGRRKNTIRDCRWLRR